MKQELKQKLREEFKRKTNRDPFSHEEMNMETDSLLIQHVLLDEFEKLEERINNLEKKWLN